MTHPCDHFKDTTKPVTTSNGVTIDTLTGGKDHACLCARFLQGNMGEKA
jgi:hypothetical protein